MSRTESTTASARFILHAVEVSQVQLGSYDENDEAVTQFVEPAPEEPKWLVQITPYDRRSMSRERLLAELDRGGLVSGDTLVWRRGMRNWSTVAGLGELLYFAEPWRVDPSDTLRPSRHGPSVPPSLPAPALAPAAPVRAVRRRSPSEPSLLLAASAASLLVVSVTLGLLAWGGAFEPGAGAEPSSTSASEEQ